ncbi:MAG: fasciclin domain-containing protein [Chloroflexota bacterium]
MKRNRTGAFAGLLLAATFVGACSSSGASAVPSTAPTTAATAAPSMAAPSMAAPSGSAAMMDGTTFGSACGAVPATGAGSFEGMATAPVATAASNNPVLSTLVTAVTAAKLGDTLNTAKDITVFAPTNDAFAAMDKATLDKAMADPSGLLSTVLTYHVVPGRLTPETLAGKHTTLAGKDLTVTGSGESFTVNGKAMVVCGNVQTANATVYIIDGVLLPPAS